MHRVLSFQAEPIQHFTSAECRDGECPAVELLGHPSFLQCDFQESCSQCAAKVGPSLTPIQTGTREAATEGPGRFEVNAQVRKSLAACRGEFVCAVDFRYG